MVLRKYETRARTEVLNDMQDVRERMKAARESDEATPSVRNALQLELAALQEEYRIMDDLESRGIEIPVLTEKQQQNKYRRDLRARRRQEKRRREQAERIAELERQEEEEYRLEKEADEREKAAELASEEGAEPAPEPEEKWAERMRDAYQNGGFDGESFWAEVDRRRLNEDQIRQVLDLTRDDLLPSRPAPRMRIGRVKTKTDMVDEARERTRKAIEAANAPDPIHVRHP